MSEATAPRGPRTRLWIALGVIVIGLSMLAKTIVFPGPRISASDVTGTVEIYDSPLRFTYHRVSGQEALFDVEADPKCLDNLLESRPEEAARLRRMLEKGLNLKNLHELRDEGKAVQLLRNLGYL